MNSSFSNNILLFILIAALLFIIPVYNLSSMLYSVPLLSPEKISSQLVEIKPLIKEKIITFGVVGFLSFLIFCYLTIIFIYSHRLRSYALATLVIFGSSSIGYFLNQQEKLEFKKGNQAFIRVDGTQDKVEVSLKFNRFPEKFLQDLQAAEREEVKIYINHRLCSDGGGRIKVILNDRELPVGNPTLLSQEEIAEVLQKKPIFIKIYGKDLPLDLRDLKGSALMDREDRLTINGKDIDLAYDKAFCISFYIKSKEGRVLRVYL